MPTPPIQSFPLRAPLGWRAPSVDVKSSGEQCANSAGRDPRTYRSSGQDWPVERPVLYDSFTAQRGEYLHHATDISCARGTPVVATTDGTVLESTVYRGERRPGAGHSENGGWYVYIRDPAGFLHYYAHMEELQVRPGELVRAGQQIGTCASTGNAAGGCPHLHYGIRDSAGRAVNPYTLLRERYDAGEWRGQPIVTSSPQTRWSWAWMAAGGLVAIGLGAWWWQRTARR